MYSFFQKEKQRFMKIGLKPIVWIAILFAVLIVSGFDMNIKEVLIYLVLYQIGKSIIYYFESKKVNWKESIKGIIICLLIVIVYHILFQLLISVGFKSIKVIKVIIGLLVATLGILSFLDLTFIIPFKILKQKGIRRK
ncbi:MULTISPECIES: hypothetical protein [Bacillaceae]|uniref:Permease n=1 Tax=Gottfriedia luciferensis TaxID=178774 RepID=A0ABX2ZU09_9BACI|nr:MULTISPECIES: hypothetical protein [Bacillaceae]ODG93246.1 hypothetical protein BED47_02870 [Gottfriedia luciferensis]PGZ95102.1 hypothetical protein COE53_00660 [Bacillus sp. AFS029533]